MVPESVMPPYAFLANQDIDASHMDAHLRVNRTLHVPYTADQIAHANADVLAQAQPMGEGAYDFSRRYPGVAIRDFDGDPDRVTDMDALIAYLQMLGTGVDFHTYHAETPDNQR
jgi:cytochrome c oxidase cbb3-type subunit 2